MAKFSAPSLLLPGVLLAALMLRVWGLGWGLPSATHYFSYHPDESVVLETAMSMNVFAGRLLPHFYNYGSLQLYLVNFANTLVFLFGGVNIVIKNLATDYGQWARMYYIGRLLTVGMGVGTVWATYALGNRLWGRRAGLLAALTLAVIPLHAQHSHFLTVDVPATFWVVLSLLWSARLATGDPKPLRAALLAGIFAGLAAATKYNMALAFLPLVLACLVGDTHQKEPNPAIRMAVPSLLGKGKRPHLASPLQGEEHEGTSVWLPLLTKERVGVRFLAALAAFVLAFLIACPGAVLDNTKFVSDLRFEAVHVQNGNDPTFRDTGNGFVYQIARNLDAGLGLPLLLLSLVSLGYALVRRERGDGLLAAFALPYYVLISLAAVRYARYTIPLLPILALWVGCFAADLSRQPRLFLRRAAVAGCIVILGWTLISLDALLEPMSETDTRDRAIAWLNKNAPASAKIGFAAQPWFGTPPISPYFSMPRPGGWRESTSPDIMQRIIYSGKDWDLNLLQSQKPPIVVMSEYDYDDPIRLHNQDVHSYLAYLDQYYYKFGIRISAKDSTTYRETMPTRDLPHDMIYPSPEIVIYQREK